MLLLIIGRIVPIMLLLLTCKCTVAQSWSALTDSAAKYKAQRKTSEAIYFYSKAKAIVPVDSLFSPNYSRLQMDMAQVYLDRSQYDSALPLALDAKSIFERNGEILNDPYATCLNLLGKLYYFKKQSKKAEEYYLQSMPIWEKDPGRRSIKYASGCNAIAVLYNDNKEYEKAISYHRQAMEIRETLLTMESAAYAQSCNNMAAVYLSMGQYEKAEPLALQARELRGRLPDVPRRDYAISCVNLANVYRDMGKYNEAEKLYIEAKDVRAEALGKQHANYLSSCDILADLYYFMKKYDQALALYLESKEIRERVSKTSYDYGQSCNNLASLYLKLKLLDKAESLALEARSVWEKIPVDGNGHLAINYNNLGVIYFARGDYAQSEQYYQRARAIWEQTIGEGHPYYIDNSISLGRLYWAKNEPKRSDSIYTLALSAQYRQLEKIFAFTSEKEKQLYLENINGAEDEFYSFYFGKMRKDNNGIPYLVSLMRRNLILGSSMRQRSIIHAKGDTAGLREYDEWIGLRQRISALYSQAKDIDDAQVAQLSRASDSLEKDLTRRSNAFGELNKSMPDWKEIRRHLKAGEAAIEFINFHYFNGKEYTDTTQYAALILRHDSREPVMVNLCEQRALDSILRLVDSDAGINYIYTRGLKVRKSAKVSIPLYNLVWRPMEANLAGIRRIYFAPAGSLHRISFAGLPVDSSRVLSDRYRLIQLSTTASVAGLETETLAARDEIKVYGAINYDAVRSETLPVNTRKAFDYLHGTEKEVNEIVREGKQGKFRLTLTSGAQALERSVKELDGASSPAVLHIATHGFFFPDPVKDGATDPEEGGNAFRYAKDPLMRSGLLFAGGNKNWFAPSMESGDDGVLTAYEVSNLYLPNTRLVVLSACETALGDIRGSEGVYGLQRAFKMAGVKNLVMSLWKVPDPETAKFMTQFYRNLFAGQTIEQSFYKAQESMKKLYRKDPYRWAAWVLIR